MHPLPLRRCSCSALRATASTVPQKAPSFLKYVHLPFFFFSCFTFFPLLVASRLPPDTSVDEAAQTAEGGHLADKAARTTASVAAVEPATQEVIGVGRGRADGRERGVP